MAPHFKRKGCYRNAPLRQTPSVHRRVRFREGKQASQLHVALTITSVKVFGFLANSRAAANIRVIRLRYGVERACCVLCLRFAHNSRRAH
jgi:hypothetical protein